jgi:PAS domain S-box-containing protein
MLYPTSPWGILLSLVGIPTILSVFVHGMSATRLELERRLQDLSTLNQVSQVIQSTLTLDSLLSVIQRQVTQILGVDCFYVALYDAQQDHIWYPLAVKFGQRQHWLPRGLMPERLTDRVIRGGKPIVNNPKDRDDLSKTDLPTSTELPEAWMGVPLITSDRATGCLAVFSLSPDIQFSNADLNLLSILSGQVSVAIDNALLYDQAHRRAGQLETLNHIMGLITASLDTQEVLSQVCRSVAQVGSGQYSAIFLLEQDKNRVTLAHASGLSDEFARRNGTFPLSPEGRTRCLRTGKPVLTPDLDSATLEPDYLDTLKSESIRAFGDFPLVTPDGQIGILSVYFDAPHAFRPEEEELLQTFASQAALAVSNAHLYAIADKALARRADQLAILESVGRELAAAINSSRLFEMILSYAMQFTNSQWGELSLFNPQTKLLEVRASRGYSRGEISSPLDQGLSGQAFTTRQPIYIGNTHQNPGHIDRTGGASQTQLSIPLIHEGRVLGALTIESAQENAYSPTDQAFIGQLATQAAVAVVNAELYSETQRRLREQSILYLISTRLVGNPELESVLQTAARSMEATIQSASVGIYLWDENLCAYISRLSLPAAARPSCQLPPIIHEGHLSAVRPALLNTGLLRPTDQRVTDAFLGSCTNCRVVIFPLVVKKQRLGMILLHVAIDQAIQEEELQLMHAMVAQVSISVQNALLFQDVTHGRDRLSAVLNSVDEGLLMLDKSGYILLANAPVQLITGLALGEIVGQQLSNLPFEVLKVLGYTRKEAEALTQDLSQGQVFSTPKVNLKLAETKPERVLERFTSPVWGQGGQIIGWMIVLRDITEEHQIAEARELITETLVHDLKSPLSAVLSAVDVIEDATSEQHDELIDQALRVAHGSAHRVLGLVESLLDIARLKSGKMELNLVPVSLHHLGNHVLSEFTTQAAEFGVIIHNDIPKDFLEVRADQSKLTRVLTNLLDNALKFTPAGGQIALAAEKFSKDMVSIQVSDTGSGIPEEYRDKVFDRFTQVPGQRGRKRGSGLGLTFCRLAVEAHGGRIWVEPRPGGGSIFNLTLPIEAAGQ